MEDVEQLLSTAEQQDTQAEIAQQLGHHEEAQQETTKKNEDTNKFHITTFKPLSLPYVASRQSRKTSIPIHSPPLIFRQALSIKHSQILGV